MPNGRLLQMVGPGSERGMRVLVCLVAIGLALPGVGHAAAPPACSTPASLTLTTRPLPHVAAALAGGGRLDVLAIGSAGLLGGRGGPDGSMPDRLLQTLHAGAPALQTHLTLRAARAESAGDMLATLRRELAMHPYQLVLWQTGTVEALRRQPPEQFRRTLADGAAAAAAGVDLVLIDLPFSRLLARSADLDPYRAALTEVALRPGVMLFPRYALMRAWVDDGKIDLEQSPRPERRRTADRLRTCLGQVLAHMLAPSAPP